MGEFLNRVFWDGGSSFDAWLNISSTKISEILLTIPHSWAQAGLTSALIAQLLHLLMGWWSGYMINLLYLKHRSLTHKEDNHITQLHEVLGGLMGKRWKALALFMNIGILFTISTVEILACSNIIFYMDNRYDKRTWTVIFGGIFGLSVLMPSAQNYRAWSFIGVMSTVYMAVYLLIVGISHEKVPNVYRPFRPRSFSEYFIPLTNFIAVGTEAIPVEIMDAMWRPQDFRTPWSYGILYTTIVSLLPTFFIFWRFGDKLLAQPSALALLPKSVFRDAAIVLLLIHQFIVFGIFSLQIYLIFEKIFNVHNSSNFARRILVRIPVFMAIWVVALAFPFFGLSSPITVSMFVTWGLHILPCAAYILTFWKAASQGRTEEKPFSSLRWEAIFSINLGIILWMIAMSGLGLWANIKAVASQAKRVGLFTKCYNCKRN